MPFQSEKQRRYLWANEPEIARDWTETYGSRVQRDNGGIMDMASEGDLNHTFENYINNGNVSVPKSFQARSHSTPVNLAYITDKEAGILQALKPGTPHRGPLEIPNYDDYDPTGGGYGRATSGQQMSAMETGGGQTEQNRVDARALGYTPQQVTDIRGGAQAAAAMGQRGRGSGFNFNPLSIIGGAFGNVGRGLGFLLGKGKDWAGKMRGGINPETGRYYTQAEFEQKRQNRRNQASIDRILKTKGMYESGEIDRPGGWEESPLKARLAGLQDLTGYTGELAQGKNELGLYTDRITPGDPGERIGQYWRGDQDIKPPASEYEGMWDNRGITGTEASMDFGKARRLITQPSQIPGANPLLPKADPYQQTSLIDPNTLNVLRSSIYKSPNEVDNINKRLGYDTSNINWAEQDTIVDDKTPYEGMVTQAGYVPQELKSKATSVHELGWNKATEEGIGAKEFKTWLDTTDQGQGFKALDETYANKLLNELKLSDKVKSLGEKYVKGLDIKGRDKYDDQRKAVGTLLEDVKTKKEALKRTDKKWMLDPNADKRSAVREFTSDYSENKDRLNDLGITTREEYEDFINKSIGIAHGGRVSKALGGRSRDI